MTWQQIFENLTQNPLAVMVVGLVFWGWSERKERIAAQVSERETLLSVIPLTSSLVKAVEIMERGQR